MTSVDAILDTNKNSRALKDPPYIRFTDYWDSFGFFDNLKIQLSREFFVLFDIARNMLAGVESSDALKAIEEITAEGNAAEEERDEGIKINRRERISPLSDKMDIDKFKKIDELKRALPSELALDESLFDVKLLTKSLLVRRYTESDDDEFKSISPFRNGSGTGSDKLEQKFYILLDRSRSMENKMRFLYAKCLVAEFLKRKLASSARLYFRSFDTFLGKLFKVEKREDFSALIYRIINTVAGSSTNLEGAIYQAVNDIRFDMHAQNSEILVVTDAIGSIDKIEMKKKLGDIRLNILKIGDDSKIEADRNHKATGEFSKFKSEHDSDDRTETGMEKSAADKESSSGKKKQYMFISSEEAKIYRDLREVSYRFIEIEDLKQESIYIVNEKDINAMKEAVDKLKLIDFGEMQIAGKVRSYKQAYFLSQYLQLLINNQKTALPILDDLKTELLRIRINFLKDAELIFEMSNVEGYDDDSLNIKLARKENRKLMKEMRSSRGHIILKDLKNRKMMISLSGRGGIEYSGNLIILLLIKAGHFVKNIFRYPLEKVRGGRK